MVTKSDSAASKRFLQEVAANGGQTTVLENSGRLFRSKADERGSRLMAARFGNVIETHDFQEW
jgi:hypothetical protein